MKYVWQLSEYRLFSTDAMLVFSETSNNYDDANDDDDDYYYIIIIL